MIETFAIMQALEGLEQSGKKAALATVVRTSGSTFRKEGAKLIVTESAEMIGSISAGCLEADVREVAGQVMQHLEPRLLKYDNTAAEEIVWGLGLGCNGVVEVFVEPCNLAGHDDIPAERPNLHALLKAVLAGEEVAALATVVRNSGVKRLPPGAKMLVRHNGEVEGSLHQEIDRLVVRDALALLNREQSKTMTYNPAPETEVDVYIDAILPPPPLLIIGADPDSVPISRLANELGFRISIVDHRPNFANSDRYPEAAATVVCPAEEIEQNVRIDEKTFVLVKTHNYLRDKEILKFVLKSNARYVGQLGPRARLEDLLADLGKEGARFSGKDLAKLYAPAGLDIGAESPEQIAFSILAEMLAIKNDRAGGFLKDHKGPIHPRDQYAPSGPSKQT